MDFISEEIENYCCRHSDQEPKWLQDLSRETWQKILYPRMLSGHLQGRFLSMLSMILRPQRVLEVGTFTGYSALCLAEGLAENGKIITIDCNDELKPIQDKYFSASPLGNKIERLFGKAMDLIPSLTPGFELIFLDADKENYPTYYELLLPLLQPGGLLLIDNTLWSGKVLTTASSGDPETKALQLLNESISTDNRVQKVMLPLRDGITIVRKNLPEGQITEQQR